MNENYIMLNGKRVDLTDEQIEKLGLKVEKKSCFNPEENDHVYYINIFGDIQYIEYIREGVNYLNRVANCCTDKSLMQQRALHETLDRLLWRFSMENDGDKIDWEDESQYKYMPFYDRDDKKWQTCSLMYSIYYGVYFYTKEIAQRAIDEIILPFMKEHPDFVW